MLASASVINSVTAFTVHFVTSPVSQLSRMNITCDFSNNGTDCSHVFEGVHISITIFQAIFALVIFLLAFPMNILLITAMIIYWHLLDKTILITISFLISNTILALISSQYFITMKHASAATVSRALTQLTSLASENIKVKRKFKNGDRASWWHVISGEENILKILEDEWEGVKRQLGWNILPCLVYSEFDVPSAAPLAPLSSSPSQSEPVNKGATSITNSLLPTTAPVLDLSEYVPVSTRVSPVTASSFANNTPSTCPTRTSPSLVHPQVPSTSVAKDPGIAVPPTSNNPGTTLLSTSSSDS